MIISPVSNRFNAGLGDLPLLFPDAGVSIRATTRSSRSKAAGAPYFQDGRILLPPTFAWGNRVANAPPNLGFPGFMNINRTQDFSISLTKVWGCAHDQGRVLPESQLQGAEPRRRRRRIVPGQHQLRQRHRQPARHRLWIRQRRARHLHELPAAVEVRGGQLSLRPGRLVRAGQLEGQPEADARLWPALRESAPAVPISTCRRRTSSRSDGRRRRRRRCTCQAASERQPVLGHQPAGEESDDTRQLLGPNTSLAIGQLVPNTGDALNGIIKAGDGIAKGQLRVADDRAARRGSAWRTT